MKEQLYPHNQQAYEKVMKAFETSNRTCIIQPTGTGKSYVVAAVCEHFQKVLVVAPNKFVLKQQKKVLAGKKNVGYITYSFLMHRIWNMSDSYDLVVLDEFHRAGAKEWGAAVQLFLESQKQAKILGTSATPIRYLDDERNMVDELFEHNAASIMDTAEAWHLNILPEPTYIIGLFNFTDLVEDTISRINSNESLSSEIKRDRIRKLNNKKIEWERSYGMPSIIKKHLINRCSKILVFCPHIDSIEEMKLLVSSWFCQAGINVSDAHIIHSMQPEKEQARQMAEFSKDNTEGIKLMFAVNVLNEGIHIPQVDTVIMLRTTTSKIIYLQQLGRCLVTSQKKKPVVLDVVDNFSTTSVIYESVKKFNELEHTEAGQKRDYVPRSFEVIDYTLDVRREYEGFSVLYPTIDERLDRVTKFCEEHGRRPNKRKPEEYSYWVDFIALIRHMEEDDRILYLFTQYGSLHTSGVFKLKLINFVEKCGRIPTYSEEDSNEKGLARYYCRHKEELDKDPEIKKIYTKYSKKTVDTLIKERLELLSNFCKTNNRFPKEGDDGEIRYAAKFLRDYQPDEYKKLYDEYGYYSVRFKIKPIIKFAEENGFLPFGWRDNFTLVHSWYSLKKNFPNDPDVKHLLEVYGEATKRERSKIWGKSKRQQQEFKDSDKTT